MNINRRITARGIIAKNGQIFCVRQRHYDKTINDFWCLPGGKLEAGESLTDCVRRELVEELGVEPEVGKLLAIQQFGDSSEESIEFFFEITNPGDYQKIDLAKTSHGQDELVEYGFIDPSTVDIRPDFLKKYPDIKMLNSYL